MLNFSRTLARVRGICRAAACVLAVRCDARFGLLLDLDAQLGVLAPAVGNAGNVGSVLARSGCFRAPEGARSWIS